jgi:phosphatidylglycerophosphatase A
LSLKREIVRFFVTGFYSGYLKPASGTWGSLLALVIAVALTSLWPAYWILPVLFVVFTIIGIAFGVEGEKLFGKKDPGQIVIDEFVGMWMTILIYPFQNDHRHWLLYGFGFFTFRILDILKPFGIYSLQKYPAGWGVMLDDIAAGVLGLGLVIVADHFLVPHLINLF